MISPPGKQEATSWHFRRSSRMQQGIYECRIGSSVQTLDWRSEKEREKACHLLQAHADNSDQQPKAPLLIKHAVSHWPALHNWNLSLFSSTFADHRCASGFSPYLSSSFFFAPSFIQVFCNLQYRSMPYNGLATLGLTTAMPCRVAVRCSPSMNFYYVEPALLPLWRKINTMCFRKALPPSQLVQMPMAEFAARMQSGCQLSHLVYPEEGDEFYYMQSQLANGMLQDIDLYLPPLSCLGRPGLAGTA